MITNDGYILTVFRVLNPMLSPGVGTGSRRPVYIQHGLFGNGDDFMLNAPGVLGTDGIYREDNGGVTNCSALDPDMVGSTLTFVLAACGYDVWLGNNRGNRYSSGHILLDSNTSKQ